MTNIKTTPVGKAISGGDLWHVTRDGQLIGSIVACFEWFMVHSVTDPSHPVRCDSLIEAANELAEPTVRAQVVHSIIRLHTRDMMRCLAIVDSARAAYAWARANGRTILPGSILPESQLQG